MESLAGQLREEKDLRADADKEIRTLREHNQALEKTASHDLRTSWSQLERDMADRLTQEAQSLREEAQERGSSARHRENVRRALR